MTSHYSDVWNNPTNYHFYQQYYNRTNVQKQNENIQQDYQYQQNQVYFNRPFVKTELPDEYNIHSFQQNCLESSMTPPPSTPNGCIQEQRYPMEAYKSYGYLRGREEFMIDSPPKTPIGCNSNSNEKLGQAYRGLNDYQTKSFDITGQASGRESYSCDKEKLNPQNLPENYNKSNITHAPLCNDSTFIKNSLPISIGSSQVHSTINSPFGSPNENFIKIDNTNDNKNKPNEDSKSDDSPALRALLTRKDKTLSSFYQNREKELNNYYEKSNYFNVGFCSPQNSFDSNECKDLPSPPMGESSENAASLSANAMVAAPECTTQQNLDGKMAINDNADIFPWMKTTKGSLDFIIK